MALLTVDRTGVNEGRQPEYLGRSRRNHPLNETFDSFDSAVRGSIDEHRLERLIEEVRLKIEKLSLEDTPARVKHITAIVVRPAPMVAKKTPVQGANKLRSLSTNRGNLPLDMKASMLQLPKPLPTATPKSSPEKPKQIKDTSRTTEKKPTDRQVESVGKQREKALKKLSPAPDTKKKSLAPVSQKSEWATQVKNKRSFENIADKTDQAYSANKRRKVEPSARNSSFSSNCAGVKRKLFN